VVRRGKACWRGVAVEIVVFLGRGLDRGRMGDECKIYVGNLNYDVQERDLDDLFYKYGRVTHVWIARNPPGYAFVEMSHPDDADEAIHKLDGIEFMGRRIRVELRKNSGRGRSDRRDKDRDGDRDRGRGGGGGSGNGPGSNAVTQKTDHRVFVDNLPVRTSWQDLKDLMRKAGEVIFTKVDRRGHGLAEFATREDMERAIREIDGMDLEGGKIRVAEERPEDRDLMERSAGGRRGGGGGRRDDRYEDRRRRSPSPQRRSPNPRRRSRSRSPMRRDRRSPSIQRDEDEHRDVGDELGREPRDGPNVEGADQERNGGENDDQEPRKDDAKDNNNDNNNDDDNKDDQD